MGRPRWQRDLAIPFASLAIALALGGCLGWVTQLTSSDGSGLSAISCPTASACVAVGGDSSGHAAIRQTTNGGSTWSTDALTGDSSALFGVSCADAQHCVAIGTSPDVLVTTDGGSHWTLSSSAPGSNLRSVSCPDAGDCWATADDPGPGSAGHILHSADGGITWTAQPWSLPASGSGGTLAYGYLQTVSCPTAEACVAVGTAVYLVTIYGTLPDTSLGSYPRTIPVLATTDDGGATWNVQFPSQALGPALSCPTSTFCVAGGTGSTSTVASSDGGATWTVGTTTTDLTYGGYAAQINGIACTDSSHCVAVNSLRDVQIGQKYTAEVEATSDGGRTWSAQATDRPDASLSSVACPTASSCWAVGDVLESGGGNLGPVILETLSGGRSSPAVAALSPDQGPASGGTLVTVTGAGFEFGVASVSFGPGLTTTKFTVESDSRLTVTAPPYASQQPTNSAPSGDTAVVDLQVTTSLGQSPPSEGDRYTYTDVPPVPAPDGIGARTSAAQTASVTITPGAPGDLLVAMVSTFNAAKVTVSGAGLSWADVLEQADTVAGDGGRISVWVAREALGSIGPVTVDSAITGNGSWSQTLQVEAFRKAGGIGATAFSSGSIGGPTPNVAITPQETGSWIALAGFDADSTATVSPFPPPWPNPLVTDGSYPDSVELSQMWFQHLAVGASSYGTVIAGDTLSPPGAWDLGAVEVLPGG